MIDVLLIARSAERRASADVLIERARLAAGRREPLAERIVQAISRLAGVAAFVAALGAILYLLIR